MSMRLILKAVGFLLLEIIGIPGNLTIVACFLHSWIFMSKFMPIDLILSKLSFVNLALVCIPGIPQSLATLGLKRLFDQQGCNFVIYIYRVCRAMSICLTSMLSCYQCVLLAPTSGFWVTIKRILVQKMLPIMIFFWLINIIIYLFGTYSFSMHLYSNTTGYLLNVEFCFIIFASYFDFLVIAFTSLVHDIICILLMGLSSLYIVIVLHRHRQQVESIRSSKWDGRSGAETKAANAVVMLACMYVFCFVLDNIIYLYAISTTINLSLELTDARIFFGSCYSALSPIVILATNKKLQLILKTLFNKKYPRCPETKVSHINQSQTRGRNIDLRSQTHISDNQIHVINR